MRKRILLLSLLVLSLSLMAQTGSSNRIFYESTPNPYYPSNENAIEDGWYMAIVEYTSHTGHQATYTLNVAVERLCVVAIDFGNGGYVHKGPNNSGYYYNGGGLYFTRDRYGNVVSASTTVRISYDNGSWQKFNITIR